MGSESESGFSFQQLGEAACPDDHTSKVHKRSHKAVRRTVVSSRLETFRHVKDGSMASLMLMHTLIQTLVQLKHFSHVHQRSVGDAEASEGSR